MSIIMTNSLGYFTVVLFYKNQISCLDGLIKHGTLYTYMYYVATFTTVCLNKMLLLFVYILCQRMSIIHVL